MIISLGYAPECIEWFQRRDVERQKAATRKVLNRRLLATDSPGARRTIMDLLARLDTDG